MGKFYLIGGTQVTETLDMLSVIKCVEEVYALKAHGDAALFPVITHVWQTDVKDMDIKSGYIGGDTSIHGLKLLTYIEDNDKLGLPRLNGTMMVFDTVSGQLRGIIDSGRVTGLRTGAAGAIGSKFLARRNSENILLVGAGEQAFFNLAGNLLVMDNIKKVTVWDPACAENARQFVSSFKERAEREIAKSGNYAAFLKRVGSLRLETADSPEVCAGEADIIITTTPSRKPLVMMEWITPGTHITCVGADMEGKQEIDERIFGIAKVYVDDVKQAVSIGETEIPVKKSIIGESEIAGEIGGVINGEAEGRTSDGDITVFDTTGLALQDLAVADLLIKRAEIDGAPFYSLN